MADTLEDLSFAQQVEGELAQPAAVNKPTGTTTPEELLQAGNGPGRPKLRLFSDRILHHSVQKPAAKLIRAYMSKHHFDRQARTGEVIAKLKEERRKEQNRLSQEKKTLQKKASSTRDPDTRRYCQNKVEQMTADRTVEKEIHQLTDADCVSLYQSVDAVLKGNDL
eukprot:TRINITY_DN222_c0_g1_i1.p1 TRINITY_DN222_c0_g1~~TRINITY_DN222_c0_g1_i1.p1  ORF type:complete len:166 (+),score=36.16 TRINITY_DN222_c0_g1_i1:614-1111(+)